jgi:hypothetical protein
METSMASEAKSGSQKVPRIRQWFSLWGAACCWVALGIAGSLITWRACLHGEQSGGASAHPAMTDLNIALFLLLLAISLFAGLLSYRTWHRLNGKGNIFTSESTGREEYMAMIGVLITTTMGVGIIWMGIPLWILSQGVRIR